jgi:hypothetical protein
MPSSIRVGEIVLDGSVVEIARADSKADLRFDNHKLRLTSVSEKAAFNYDLDFYNALPPGEISARGRFAPCNSGNAGETAIAGEYDFQNPDLGSSKALAERCHPRINFKAS